MLHVSYIFFVTGCMVTSRNGPLANTHYDNKQKRSNTLPKDDRFPEKFHGLVHHDEPMIIYHSLQVFLKCVITEKQETRKFKGNFTVDIFQTNPQGLMVQYFPPPIQALPNGDRHPSMLVPPATEFSVDFSRH